MTKNRVKLTIFFVGLPLAAVIALVIFRELGNFMASFQKGADPASIFNGFELEIPESDKGHWLTDDPNLPRIPTEGQRDEIIASYWQAWYALERAYETGDTSDLPTYWAGHALQEVQEAVIEQPKLRQKTSQHQLQLHFFSDDGSVAAFTDVEFMLEQTLDGTTMRFAVSSDVVMTLDNGYWRIRVMTFVSNQIGNN